MGRFNIESHQITFMPKVIILPIAFQSSRVFMFISLDELQTVVSTVLKEVLKLEFK